MNLFTAIICVAAGGSLGALARYAVSAKLDTNAFNYPFGTFLVNMAASFILGLLTAFAQTAYAPTWWDALAETGFCATLSTFSSLAWQIAEMLRAKRFFAALIYSATSLMFGMSFFLLGNKLI